jgi:hypothetical protein
VWPLEPQVDVVRVGRNRIEYWAATAKGLALRGEQRFDYVASPRAADLAAALRTLLADVHGAGAAARPPTRAVDLVVESAWLPVMLVDVGESLLSRKTIEALLRHRLAQQFGDKNAPAAAWVLQIDHQPGESQALGYGLAPATRRALLDSVAAAGWRVQSLRPALAWGWQRLDSRRRAFAARKAQRSAWWIWSEQDRSLIGHCNGRGRFDALNAGAAAAADDADCVRLIRIEALRHGLAQDESRAIVVDWRHAVGRPQDAAGSRVARLSLAATDAVAPMASAPPMRAGASA